MSRRSVQCGGEQWTTFSGSPGAHFFTSESVTEGHPDKVCDQISDAVLDAVLAADPKGRVACESATTTGLVMVFGEITTTRMSRSRRSYGEWSKRSVTPTSHTGSTTRPAASWSSIKAQSPEISDGVNTALEARNGLSRDDEIDRMGAGDQGMMIGFACQ